MTQKEDRLETQDTIAGMRGWIEAVAIVPAAAGRVSTRSSLTRWSFPQTHLSSEDLLRIMSTLALKPGKYAFETCRDALGSTGRRILSATEPRR